MKFIFLNSIINLCSQQGKQYAEAKTLSTGVSEVLGVMKHRFFFTELLRQNNYF